MKKVSKLNAALILISLAAVWLMFFSGNPDASSVKVPHSPEPPPLGDSGVQSDSASEKMRKGIAVIGEKVMYPSGYNIESEIKTEISGDLRVEILDETTICLVGDYDSFLKERLTKECLSFLKDIEKSNLPDWNKGRRYSTLAAQMIMKYRPKIAEAFRDFSKFKISNEAEILRGGYWLNANGQMEIIEPVSKNKKLTKNAHVAHFAFLKLKSALKENLEYVLTNPLGQSVRFKYEGKGNISEAIKINQVGYAPNAGRKYAYLGAWLGSMGKMEVLKYAKTPFKVINAKTGKTAFLGRLSPRVPDVAYNTGAMFTGEDVLEADFSILIDEGIFYIEIEGVGRSEIFKISNDAIGEAFFIHAKGIFHKRCGIAKQPPCTNWIMGECHRQIYASNFPPIIEDYSTKKGRNSGFFDDTGKPVSVRHFKLIELNAPKKAQAKKIEVHGGWHDAADFDRRPQHFTIVSDLLSSYIFRPQNFSDNQLNIPESGNGIPDIIDEAEWGMLPWLQTQAENGAAGGWIEAVSHPVNYNASTDTQEYYLSAQTRESSIRYAAHASMIALAFEIAGQKEKKELYLNSAIRAYEFAINIENTFRASYLYPKDLKARVPELIKLDYREASEIPPEFLFKTAFNLWFLTRDKKYLEACASMEKIISKKFTEIDWRLSPLMFSEFLKYGSEFKELLKIHSEFRKAVFKYANERVEMLNNNYPYRIPWYPPENYKVKNMAWGNYHPMKSARFFVAAYELTKDPRFRDAAYICNDFHNGANPTGSSMTAGLGRNYPVRFLDLISYVDGIDEFVLGITPYRNTFGIQRDDILWAHSLVYESPVKDKNFNPPPTLLLPESMVGKEFTNADELAAKIGRAWPIWRRFTNLENYAVKASEYTIDDTMGPPAAVSGWLLESDWKPSKALKNIEPAPDVKKLKGYSPLP